MGEVFTPDRDGRPTRISGGLIQEASIHSPHDAMRIKRCAGSQSMALHQIRALGAFSICRGGRECRTLVMMHQACRR